MTFCKRQEVLFQELQALLWIIIKFSVWKMEGGLYNIYLKFIEIIYLKYSTKL